MKARKPPPGQSRAPACMTAGLQNLISLTALAGGFKSGLRVGSTETKLGSTNILQERFGPCQKQMCFNSSSVFLVAGFFICPGGRKADTVVLMDECTHLGHILAFESR